MATRALCLAFPAQAALPLQRILRLHATARSAPGCRTLGACSRLELDNSALTAALPYGAATILGLEMLSVTKQPGEPMPSPPLAQPAMRIRNQAEARRVADTAYPFRCCVVCGLQVATCLQIAHLDQDATNNEPGNLAHLCPTHHWMYDAGLYPVEAIRLQQTQWQVQQGQPDHGPRMKDAGTKAALKRKRSATARKAVATRRANAARILT